MQAQEGDEMSQARQTEIMENVYDSANGNIKVALGAGTALLGKVGIDQATANANEVVTKTGSVTTATLAAETTKVIGTVNISAGQSVQATDASLPTTPAIYNVSLASAATEYSQALPSGTKRFSVSIQDGSVVNNFRVAFVTGKVATPTAPYIKRPCNVEYFEDGINLTGATLYLAGSNAGDVAQVIAWT
jgi:hypothetical protein